MSAELVHISPTQWELFLLCARKWAFYKIMNLREPETRQLALGTRVHAVLEAYLRDATVPELNETWTFRLYLGAELASGDDKRVGEAKTALAAATANDLNKVYYPGRIAITMMPKGIFPAPGIGEVEHEFEFEDRGVVWNGKVDWHAFNPTVPMPPDFADVPGAVERGLIVVIDHKSSSDPKKWGKLGDDEIVEGEEERSLRVSPQGIIYARAMLARYGSANVILHWNYGCTDGKPSKARVATARLAPGEVYAMFENLIVPVGQEIRRLRLMNAEPLSLEASPGSCFAYHKQCPHAQTCNLTTTERLANIMAGNALIDNLLKKSGATPTQPGATPAQPAPPPVPPGNGVNPPEASTQSAAPTPPAAPAAPTPPKPVTTAAPAPTPPAPTPPAPTPPAPTPAAAAKAYTPGVDALAATLGGSELAELIANKVADKIVERLLGK